MSSLKTIFITYLYRLRPPPPPPPRPLRSSRRERPDDISTRIRVPQQRLFVKKVKDLTFPLSIK